MKKLLAWLIPVLAAGLLGWGAWVTVGVSGTIPRSEYEEHVKANQDRFIEILKEVQRQREAIEEKLDDIQKRLPKGHDE